MELIKLNRLSWKSALSVEKKEAPVIRSFRGKI
jgi:hypothetical protein